MTRSRHGSLVQSVAQKLGVEYIASDASQNNYQTKHYERESLILNPHNAFLSQ
jgi:hypothetical protein